MKVYKNKFFIILILVFFWIIIPNTVDAAKTGFIENIPAPRKYFNTDKNQLSDVTLTLVGSSAIEPEKVKLYEVDSSGKNAKLINFSEGITTNKKNHIYKLSHTNLLKSKTHYFYIEVEDSKGIINKSNFTISVNTKTVDGKEVKWYGIDDSPRLKDWIASESTLYFVVKDLEGIKSLKIQDMNNGNKEIISLQNLDKGEELVIVDTTKFKAEKEIYNLQIVAQENDSTYSQKSTQTVSFKLSHEKAGLYPNSIKLDKTKLTLDIYNKKTATLKVTTNPINATERKITWTSSNTKVATVDTNGKITAKAGGTTTITAKTQNGKTAKCEVTVNAYSTPSTTKPKSASGDGYTQTITLANRTFKLYKQYTGSYSTTAYHSANKNLASTESIATLGCGPSSIAIVLSGYGYNYNPGEIGKKLLDNSTSQPSALNNMKSVITKIGQNAKVHTFNSNYDEVYSQIKTALSNGHQIVLYVGKRSDISNQSAWINFTDSGSHFISVLGIDTSNDKVFVGDPSKSGGWFSLSTVVQARGNMHSEVRGWIEIY